MTELLDVELGGDQLEGSGGVHVLDEVAQGGVVFPDGLEDRNRLGCDLAGLGDLLSGQAGLLGELVVGGLAAETLGEVGLSRLHLVDGVHHVDRDPDGAALVGNRPRDRLANPPGGICGELEALAVLELLHCADEPEIAFLDEVEEREAGAAITLCDRDDETEVGADEGLTGLFTGPDELVELTTLGGVLLGLESDPGLAAGLDGLGQPNFVLGGQQVVGADAVEILTNRLVTHFTFDRPAHFPHYRHRPA